MFGLPPLPRTLPASLRDTESKKADVRASALGDLVRHALGDDAVRAQAVPILERALHDDAPLVRRAACVGLGDLGAAEALPKLLVAMEDADEVTRQVAINAVGEIGDARALPRLSRALSDARPDVRYQAVIAFSRISDDAGDVERALGEALSDEDDAIVHIALRVAEERADRGDRLGGALEAAVLRRLDASNVSVRLAAAILACKLGAEAGRPLVERAVRGDLPGVEKEDEAAAVELAGELGLEALRPFLLRRAFGVRRFFGDTCAYSARIALARMGDARARAAILADLESSRPDLRAAAVVAVGRARLAEGRREIERMTAASVDPGLVREALARLDRASS